MNVLVLAALTEATGNAVTARRIARHLETKHRVVLRDAVGERPSELRSLVSREHIDTAVGVHALLSGAFLRALDVPYTLVFGGTDLYEAVHPLQQDLMASAVTPARRLVAFSPENRARAEWLWPSVTGRVRVVPQAVDVPEPVTFSLRERLGLGATDVMVLLPTGLRRVKDPLHAIDALSVWHAIEPRVHLVLVGAVLDPSYGAEALEVLSERPGVHYVSALPHAELLAAMREADVVLNTSLSEGMCGSLLDAMSVGTPVVARRNAGNESLVVHGHTGLLYDTPREIVHWISALTSSRAVHTRIARAAAAYVKEVHAAEREREAYLDIVDDVRTAPAAARAVTRRAEPLDEVVSHGVRLGLDASTVEALHTLAARMARETALLQTCRDLGALLATAPPTVAIDAVRRSGLEALLGREGVRAFYLLLALSQVPAAEARHAARGISPDVTRSTLSDLTHWVRSLRAQTGAEGITLETLAWAQRYLRGELVQFGPLQFDLRAFTGPLRAFRARSTRAICAASLDGRIVDLASGVITGAPAPTLDPAEWEPVLEPGSPILEMWISLNSVVAPTTVLSGIRDAFALFARLAPETKPVAVCGESWRLDPGVLPFVAPELGVHALQAACRFYPSALSEAKTLRRLFGPDVERRDLDRLPREGMNVFQRAVLARLATPGASLRARCGFVLRDEVLSMPEAAEVRS